MKKRLLSLILMLAMVSGISTGCSTTEKNEETTSPTNKTTLTETTSTVTTADTSSASADEEISDIDWVSLYTDFIVANKDEEFPNVNYIGLNDLNFDGIPELILSDAAASAAYSIGILHIKDGEVKLLYGYSSMAGNSDMTKGDFYSNFFDNWLSLRKNVNTGELRYFLASSNGSSCESFGDTFSFPVTENKEIGLATETSYEILYDDETFEMTDEFYYVLEESVTADKYLQVEAELESTWVDTGVRTPAMTNGHYEYSNAMELSLEKTDLENFFALYEKEF